MEELIRIIVEYVAIWAPSLVAILSVISTSIPALIKTKEALVKLKNDETIKNLSETCEKQAKENAELRKSVDLMLDELTKIKGYAEEKKKKRG